MTYPEGCTIAEIRATDFLLANITVDPDKALSIVRRIGLFLEDDERTQLADHAELETLRGVPEYKQSLTAAQFRRLVRFGDEHGK